MNNNAYCFHAHKKELEIDMPDAGEKIITSSVDDAVDVSNQKIEIFDVISTSFNVLIKNFVPFFILALIITAPPLIINLFILPNISGIGVNGEYIISAGAGLIDFLFTYILTAALVYGTLLSIKGEKVTIGNALSHGLKRFLPILGIGFVLSILIMVASVFFFIPALIVVAIYIVSVPVTVVEKLGVFASMQRSADLTRGQRWRTFGIALVGLVIWMTPTFVIGFFLGATENSDFFLNEMPIIDYLYNSIGSAYFSVVVAVTYHKLRMTKEGLNLKDLAAVFD